MVKNPNNIKNKKLIIGGITLLILALLLGRFIQLNADFPMGITKSAVLYTDEGWYTAGAVRHFLTGHWHVKEDVNMAVMMPFGFILHRITFSVLGLSTSTARITIILSFLILVILSGLLVRRNFGDYAGLITALLLASNYIGFAYSRLVTTYLLSTCNNLYHLMDNLTLFY